MRRLLVGLLCGLMLTMSAIPVCAAESAKAPVTAVGAPDGVAVATDRALEWVCNMAGNFVEETYPTGVLLNTLQVQSTAEFGHPGDYTFSAAAVRKGMNVKVYGTNDFDLMWTELPVKVNDGSLTVTMDSVATPYLTFVVVK